MTSRLAKFRELPRAERALALGLAVLLPIVAALLRVAGYARTRRLVEWWSTKLWERRKPRCPPDATQPGGGELPRAQRLAALADAVGRRGLVRAACLPQALVVFALLRRRGLNPAFVLGARLDDRVFGAHAWVALDGVALGRGGAGHTAFGANDTGVVA